MGKLTVTWKTAALVLAMGSTGAHADTATATADAKPAIAGEYTVMTPPDPNSIALFVLQNKAAEFLPEGVSIKIKSAPGGDVAAMKAMMVKGEVDYALFNATAGGKFYSQGITNIKMAGTHVWGGVGILSKVEIAPGDWQALKGTSGFATPAIKTPPHMLSSMAMMKNGVNPKTDIMVAGAGPGVAFKQMARKASAPDFIMLPEPLLSIALFKQNKQEWEQKYHLFANSVAQINGFGVPLGSFWVVNDTPATNAIIYGYEKAINYVNDPANREEVGAIVAKGFATEFGMKLPPKLFIDMLNRDMLKLKFRDAVTVKGAVRGMWKKAGFKVDDGIFYSRLAFKVPSKSIFISNMMPRMVGTAGKHGKQIGLSPATHAAAMKIRKMVHATLPAVAAKAAAIESQIFDASNAADFAKVDALLVELAAVKLEASRLQLECVRRTHAEYPEADLAKLLEFLRKNKGVIANFNKI